MFKEVKKILFFRLCCFGDVVMLTPVINNLHKFFPEAQIDIAASGWIKSLLPYLPNINKAIVFDGPFKKSIFSRIYHSLKLILQLRREKYDLVFVAHRNNVYGLILKLAGIRYRLGFSETKHLTHLAGYDQSLHFVDRHLKVLTDNGISADDKNLLLKRSAVKNKLKSENNINPEHMVIGIFPFGGANPGTKMIIKRWEFEKYIDLINKIITGNKNITIILFEGLLSDEIINDNINIDNVRVLNISIDMISLCDVFISCDTGPLYIAEAFGVSTLSIFGPSDSDVIAPKSRQPGVIHKNLNKKIYCSPCYTSVTAIQRNNPQFWRGDNFICHTGTHECMKSISVEDVYIVLEEMMIEIKNNA